MQTDPVTSPSSAHVRRAAAEDLLPRLRLARDHMDRHFAVELDLAAVAGIAGVSRYHFVRAFQSAYGQTPMRYLTQRRIERAQDLLRHADLTVTEICMAVGFSSLGSFSARFRELVGVSPTAYRDQWAGRAGPQAPGCWLFMRAVLDLPATAGPDVGRPPSGPEQVSNAGEAGGHRGGLASAR